ncbi:hypothetical protein [Nocardioides okcheonensis]|uniref:hypothetical protein n=1 Tax=Nocardioides okcheonensis TaxID=2894081 RepID=UPI001E3E58DD|nr:hypothetical protein [Nocardioides okcheonensis]UFN44512.1 hypothetical protein LN652_21125 [Nocardioides okcheonensis]
MTLIAFAIYPDRAEIITDTAAYALNGSAFGRTSKVVTIPHLDTAVMTQGDTVFGNDAKAATMQVAAQVATFDQLVEHLADPLRDLWCQRREEWAGAAESVVFVVGYSPRAERFVAYGFATERDDLEPFAIDRPWVMPCPWDLRPDELQVSRFLAEDAAMAAADGEDPMGQMFVDQRWSRTPELAPPADVETWDDLARQVREQRAVNSPWRSTFVAGDVFHTKLEQGSTTTARRFTFDDEGDDFLAMIHGTQHPIAQLMECQCGSGERAIECHLAEQLDDPCGCKDSGKTFRECCAVDVSRVVAN